jgi:hypothetical protein
MCARDVGLIDDPMYVADLKLEAADMSFLHDAAMILQLVSLRAVLDGRRQG